jgi:hypothetical protein
VLFFWTDPLRFAASLLQIVHEKSTIRQEVTWSHAGKDAVDDSNVFDLPLQGEAHIIALLRFWLRCVEARGLELATE